MCQGKSLRYSIKLAEILCSLKKLQKMIFLFTISTFVLLLSTVQILGQQASSSIAPSSTTTAAPTTAAPIESSSASSSPSTVAPPITMAATKEKHEVASEAPSSASKKPCSHGMFTTILIPETLQLMSNNV